MMNRQRDARCRWQTPPPLPRNDASDGHDVQVVGYITSSIPRVASLKLYFLHPSWTTRIAMADSRLAQVSGHLSNAYGRGLLAGEVAIITGMCFLLRTCSRVKLDIASSRCWSGMYSSQSGVFASQRTWCRVLARLVPSFLPRKERKL